VKPNALAIVGSKMCESSTVDGSDGGQFTFSIIQNAEEQERVFEFMQKHFRVQEPITRAIGSTEEDTYTFYRDICENAFKGPYSLMACSSSGELAGICLNAVYEDLPSSSIEEDKKEYAKEISEGPYTSPNANRLIVLIELTEKGIDRFIPPSMNKQRKIFKIDVISVHPSFMGCGLGSQLIQRSLQMARTIGCEYAFTCATARASNHIFTKFGFTPVRRILFNDFLENGQPVYKNLHDEGTGCTLMMLKL